MYETGTVISVEARPVGVPVIADAAINDSVIEVEDNVNVSTGDQLLITPPAAEEGTLYVVSGVDAATRVFLATPLAEAAPTDTWAALYPLQTETVAEVRLVDTGAVITCVVNHALADALRPGIRDEATAERVLMVEDQGTRYVVDVISRTTIRDLTTALPGMVPAAPTVPVLTTLAYLDSAKRIQSQIKIDWDPVTEDAEFEELLPDGLLQHYEIQIRSGPPTGGGGAWSERTRTDDTVTEAYLSPFPPGTEWSLRVRAVTTEGVPSAWSDAATITTATDNVPPAQPSKPVLTTRLGIIRVKWDGLNKDAGAMDDDLAYVEVHGSPDSFTPVPGDRATLLGHLTAAGEILKAGAAYGDSWFFRFVAVDTSGNVSTPSVEASVSTAPLVDTDLIGQIIAGANIKDGTLVASDKIIGNTITGGLIQALAIATGHLKANAVTADKADFGLMTGMIVRGDVFETDPDPFQGIKISLNGLTAYNAAGAPSVSIFGATGALETGGGSGPRVRMSTASNAYEGQQWGLIQFFNGSSSWNPAQLWANTTSGGSYGNLRIAGPYRSDLSWDYASSITLGATLDGTRHATIYSQRLDLNAESYYLGSGLGSIDFRLQGTNLFQIIGASGVINFNTNPGGLANSIGSWSSGSSSRAPLSIFAGGNLNWSIAAAGGTRTLTMQPSFNYPSSPNIIDGAADVGLTFRQVGPGRLDICDWSGDNYKTIRASDFNVSSDIAHKDSLEPVTGALAAIEALEFVDYDIVDISVPRDLFRTPEAAIDGRGRGVVAQQAQPVLPEIVAGSDSPGDLGVGLYAFATTIGAAVKELSATVREHATEVADLRQQIAALTSGEN